jgi:CheY-like chemotaxis protein
VELHSGRIEAASDGEGRGAVFSVSLPVTEPLDVHERGAAAAVPDFEQPAAASARILDAATAAAERDPHAPIGGPAALSVIGMETPLTGANGEFSEASLRILLVEDHDGIARACQRLLVSHGHFVIRAAGAASALTAAEREKFDLLICDLSLPDGNGLELLSGIRARSERLQAGLKLPAIAISGSVYDDDIARCLAAGFSAHVAKPFDEDGLLAVIAQVFEPDAAQRNRQVRNGGIPSPVPARLR